MLLKFTLKLKQSSGSPARLARVRARILAKAREVLGAPLVLHYSMQEEKGVGILLARMQDREARLAARRRQHPR